MVHLTRLCLVAVVLAPALARAQADDGDKDKKVERAAPAPVDNAAAGGGYQQPFAFMDDPSLPGAKHAAIGYAIGVGSSAGALRPVQATPNGTALVHALGVDIGIVPRVSLFTDAYLEQPISGSSITTGAVAVGGRVLLTRPSSTRLRVVVKTAFLRDFAGGLGGFVQATGSYDLGRFRLAATAHVEKIFAPGRDAIDLVAVVGASVRVAAPLRLGVEYIAQDLEELGGDGAEAGMRGFVGPDLALTFLRNRLLVAAGTAVETARHPSVVGRGTLTYLY
jgi:hypothetical protein